VQVAECSPHGGRMGLEAGGYKRLSRRKYCHFGNSPAKKSESAALVLALCPPVLSQKLAHSGNKSTTLCMFDAPRHHRLESRGEPTAWLNLTGAAVLLAGEKALKKLRALTLVCLRSGLQKSIADLSHAATFACRDRFELPLKVGPDSECKRSVLFHRGKS
jgi:hypothetical protein